MKKTSTFMISVLILTLTGINVNAQKDDTKAKAILDSVSATMKAYSTMIIAFTYTMINTKTKVNETKSGTIKVKGSKFKLEVGGQIVFCDGKTKWTYIKDDNEVTINNASTADEANPTNILTNYALNYKPKWIKDVIEGGKSLAVIDMTPIKAKSYSKVRLNIIKSAKQISSSTIYDKNGSEYTYKVNKFTTNLVMADTIFTFNKADYPGVTENDMR
jgi:outer membrane lipoprotein carrier protein